jgi:DNA-binding NtrC family response regulator
VLEAANRGAATRRHRWYAGISRVELLSSSELDALRKYLKLIARRIDPILQLTFRLYVGEFPERRSLSAISFFDVYRPGFIAATNHLLARRLDEFARDVVTLGETLAERRVPFEEIVACCHLLTRAVIETVGGTAIPLETCALLDKLGHARIMLLTEAYFRARIASSATRIGALEREARQIARDSRTTFHGLVGSSPSMRHLYSQIETAARADLPVLLVGEEGTEKEVVARAIHELRSSLSSPFNTLSCSSLAPDLIEPELFGYHRGAFTGAIADYPGLARASDGGSLLIDDLTSMPLGTQRKLLHLLENRVVRPLASAKEFALSVRIIASLQCDPEDAFERGRLDRELMNRFAASVITLPALRDRRDDIPLLTEQFIGFLNVALELPVAVAGIDGEALSAMQRYDWPGNVRELAAAIEHAVMLSDTPTIHLEDLPLGIAHGTIDTISLNNRPPGPAALSTIAEVERELIRRTLATTRGNKSSAARLLSISRKKLYARIARYGLS